jgi:hypothetical protein
MSEQIVEERRGWASDIVWVVLYSRRPPELRHGADRLPP